MLLCTAVAAVELPAAELLMVASICARAVVQSWMHSLQQTCFALVTQDGIVACAVNSRWCDQNVVNLREDQIPHPCITTMYNMSACEVGPPAVVSNT